MYSLPLLEIISIAAFLFYGAACLFSSQLVEEFERYSTEIVVKGFQGVVNLLGRREKRDTDDSDQSERRSARERPAPPVGDLDDEIPF